MNIDSATNSHQLDVIFSALADPTRRDILARLTLGDASVNEIMAPYDISQPAISRHLKVLERAGLVERDQEKQRRPARLRAANMTHAVDWLAQFQSFWPDNFMQLDSLLMAMQNTHDTKETQ